MTPRVLKMQQSPVPGEFKDCGTVLIKADGSFEGKGTPEPLNKLLTGLTPRKFFDGPVVPKDDPKYAEAAADEIERASNWYYSVKDIVNA